VKKSTIYIIVLSIIISIVFFTNCQNVKDNHQSTNYSEVNLNEQLMMSILYMQTSAEYRALCYQTFNLAKLNIDKALSAKKTDKPLAVIVDADETIIDNSAYEAFLIGKNFGYSPDTWNKWMDAAEAKAVPGALEFLNYASKKGVEIFYITNRRIVGYKGTQKNLEQLGFPIVDKKHLLLRTDTSNKQPRRDLVEKSYNIVFLMGDNLNDFLNVFAEKSTEERFAETDKLKEEWGKKFIVLPNPMYGEWASAVIDYKHGASAEEKDKMRKQSLRGWKIK
jgi:5'-nucleotidase (lipoprotein e(P4) family)